MVEKRINPKYQEAMEKLLIDTSPSSPDFESVSKFVKGEIDKHPLFKFEGKKWFYKAKEPRFINVFCVCVGNKYNLDYVRNLRNMINKNLTIPHKFICLTDRYNHYKGKDDVEGIEFKQAFITMPDSWCKLSLFHHKLSDYGYSGKALYFDLDVVIVDNIDNLVANEEIDGFEEKTIIKEGGEVIETIEVATFSIIKDWNRNTYNSSMMIWEIGKVNYFHSRFRASDIRIKSKFGDHKNGDQDLITELLNEKGEKVHVFDPKKVRSYKSDNLNRGFTKPMKVAIFHGKPKPHEFRQGKSWVNKYWK